MPGPRYKWVILSLSFLMMFLIGIIDFTVPYLLSPIMKDLGLTYSEGGLVFGTLFLGFIFFGPIGGAIIDRFGVRNTLALATLFEGLGSLLRGFSTNFLDIFIYSLAVSICTVVQVAGIGRSTSEWFDPKELGRANGIWNAGFALGALIASAITVPVLLPTMQGWRGVFEFLGALCFVVAVGYAFLARDKVRTKTKVAEY